MTFATFLIISGCVAIGYWVVTSVMSDDADQPDRDTAVPSRAPSAARPAPSPAARTVTRPAPRNAPRPVTPPSARTTARPEPQPVAKRAPARPRTTSRTVDPLSNWSVVLDVPVDAPRIEILAAVKRRLAQARTDRDTVAMARITRAAQEGLRLRPKR